MKERLQKIIKDNYDEDDLKGGHAYLLYEEGVDSVVLYQKNFSMGVMFDLTTGDMVGLQPIEYVEEFGERIW